MTSIGIGKLEKASSKTISRHTFEPSMATSTNDNASQKTTPPTYNSGSSTHGQLSVDVYQTEAHIVIIAPIAGTPGENISISITEDVLTIKGQREIPTKDAIRQEDFYIQECFWGNFSRSIVLPAAVDTTRVEAHFKNNVLTVIIPKTELVKTRVIRIKEE